MKKIIAFVLALVCTISVAGVLMALVPQSAHILQPLRMHSG